jgi:ethanolamine utilization protein EutQ (cupin superfamily)
MIHAKLIRGEDLNWVEVPGREGAGARMAEVVTAQDTPRMASGFIRMDEGVSINRRIAYDELVYVIEGRMEVRTGDKLQVAGRGDSVLLPEGVVSHVTWTEPSHCLFAIAPGNWRELIETPLATS